MANIHLTIDDQELEVAEGLTILEAARQNGIHIPTLCYLKEWCGIKKVDSLFSRIS